MWQWVKRVKIKSKMGFSDFQSGRLRQQWCQKKRSCEDGLGLL